MEKTDSLPTRSRGALSEFFELLLRCFGDGGVVKNDWLMPFEPGPSSFPRTPARQAPRKLRRRPF